MSSGVRLPLDVADRIAAVLVERWGGPASGLEVVGSVRRRKRDVGDLEFVAPMPEGHGRVPRDALFEAIAATVEDGTLKAFAGPMPFGLPGPGLRAGFRHAGVLVDAAELRIGVDLPARVKVEVYRYDAGALGNRGWILLMRTGPADFGRDVLARYKARRGGSGPASEGGYLRDAVGRPVPTPDEGSVFRLAGMAAVPPDRRGQ